MSDRPGSTTRSAIRALATACVVIAGTTSAAAAQRARNPIGAVVGTVPRALAIEDYYRIPTVGAPALSPDGRWVAFTISTHTEATNEDSSQVWLVASSGSAPPTRVSPADANAGNPTWLEGGRLRFSGSGRTWTLDPAAPAALSEAAAAAGSGGRAGRGGGRGGAGMRLTSPDGRWIATVRDMPVPHPEPVYASAFEKRAEARFKGVAFDWLNFQRDGAPFPVPNASDPAVSPPQEIFMAPSSGSEQQVTHLGLRPIGTQWSPDGATLLFTADSLYRDERHYPARQVWTVGRDGTVGRLTSDPEHDYSGAAWSPDGRWVLATRETSTNAIIAKRMDNGGPTDLVLLPARGGPARVLTADWDYLPAAARWSPDGRFVYFTGGIGGTVHLFRVPVDGRTVEQVTHGERRLTGLSFDSAMTKVAFLVGRMDAPSEVAIADIDGRNERMLTHVHDAFTREVALAAPERLHFASRDGTEIEGWLYSPHDFRPDGGPYPLIVFSHGGPHSATGYTFDFKLQYFAANGYFVLATNFRSSTGYGEKFLWATWGAWGDRDGEDVMAGVDYVIAHYPADRARVATVGHSYGGFMSNWLITHYPDRFAAACVGAGIVNWMSDYGTADIAVTKETEFYGSPWNEEARNRMIRQSPLIHADRVKAATLFINGEVDQRVPYSEAEQMYVALKKNGVPAKVIQYAGMPHSISGAWNNVHRMLNEQHWIDTYLAPASTAGPRP